MSIKKIALVSSSLAVAAAGITLPMTAANASIDLGDRSGDTVQITAQKTAKVNKRFTINCQTSPDLVGGKVLLFQNGSQIKLTKVLVGATGACNFGFISGIKGKNVLDVAVKKSGKAYQSNSIVVKVKPVKGQTATAKPKNTIKLSGPKTGKIMKRINLKCTAPASLAGGLVTLYQNGNILPQKSKFMVGSGGSCNFWIKSGISGVNKIDMAVTKAGKIYQSNAVKITVS